MFYKIGCLFATKGKENPVSFINFLLISPTSLIAASGSDSDQTRIKNYFFLLPYLFLLACFDVYQVKSEINLWMDEAPGGRGVGRRCGGRGGAVQVARRGSRGDYLLTGRWRWVGSPRCPTRGPGGAAGAGWTAGRPSCLLASWPPGLVLLSS